MLNKIKCLKSLSKNIQNVSSRIRNAHKHLQNSFSQNKKKYSPPSGNIRGIKLVLSMQGKFAAGIWNKNRYAILIWENEKCIRRQCYIYIVDFAD